MCKQVLVIRKDLKVRLGKGGAQFAHGTVMWLADRFQRFGDEVFLSELEKDWLFGKFGRGGRVIVLGVADEAELLAVFEKAKAKNLMTFLVTDCGLTEFGGIPTNTVVAIGPHEDEVFTGVTDDLKPY